MLCCVERRDERDEYKVTCASVAGCECSRMNVFLGFVCGGFVCVCCWLFCVPMFVCCRGLCVVSWCVLQVLL